MQLQVIIFVIIEYWNLCFKYQRKFNVKNIFKKMKKFKKNPCSTKNVLLEILNDVFIN